MQLEQIIGQLGDFGVYQRLLYCVACHASLCSALETIFALYALNVPKHRCRIPQLGKDDSWNLNSSIVSQFVPSVDCGNSEGDSEGGCFDSCRLFSNVSSNETVGCVAGWVYDTSEFDTTFSMENNYVCSAEGQFMLTMATQSFFIGILVGSLFVGFLADRFGRRPVLVACLLLQGVSGLITGFISGSIEFWICRFICGMANSGVFPTAFVLGIEFIGASKRLHAGFIIEYVFAVGLILVAVAASWIRSWRWLTIASSCVSLSVVFYFWFLSESPRWLMAVGRYAEAEIVIRRAARVNRVTLPDNLSLQENTSEESEVAKETCASVFRYRRLVCLFVNIIFQWFAIALIYQGLSFNSAALPGNIFFTSAMNAVAELSGYLMAHLLLAIFGRKKPQVFSMLSCGVLLLSTMFLVTFNATGLSWLFLVLALLGKMGVSAAYAIVYLWTAEQVATSLRQTVIGVAALSSRFGNIIGPFVNDLAKILHTALGDSLQLVLFGGLAVVAGFAALQMPETMGRRLPETLKEGDDLMKAQRLGCSCRSSKVEVIEDAEHTSTGDNQAGLGGTSYGSIDK